MSLGELKHVQKKYKAVGALQCDCLHNRFFVSRKCRRCLYQWLGTCKACSGRTQIVSVWNQLSRHRCSLSARTSIGDFLADQWCLERLPLEIRSQHSRVTGQVPARPIEASAGLFSCHLRNSLSDMRVPDAMQTTHPLCYRPLIILHHTQLKRHISPLGCFHRPRRGCHLTRTRSAPGLKQIHRAQKVPVKVISVPPK